MEGMSEEKNDKKSNDRAKVAGTAVGIGSAAIAAALIYANRRKKMRKPKPTKIDHAD
jgi:alkylation response protein AidB-like acyl-CoA dehydrogenase